MGTTQIVFEMLPALNQSRRHIEPAMVLCRFEQDHESARCEQILNLLEGRCEVP